MFASTLLSAATALFVFAPAAFGAPLATRDVSVSKITEIQSTISEANTHLSSLVTKFSETTITTDTVDEWVSQMTEVQTIVHEVHSKVVEVQGLTLDANVKVDVGLIVEEVTKLVSLVTTTVAPVKGAANEVLVKVHGVVVDVTTTVFADVVIVNGVLGLTISGVTGEVTAVLGAAVGLVGGIAGGVVGTLNGVLVGLFEILASLHISVTAGVISA